MGCAKTNKSCNELAQTFSPDEGAFTLSELGSAAKEHAHQLFVGFTSQEQYWSEYVIDNAKEEAPTYFNIEDVHFSGFGSQGDGASWVGYIDARAWCEVHGVPNAESLIESGELSEDIEIKTQGNYAHSGTMSIPDLCIPREIELAMLSEARSYADQIYKDLEESYEADTSLEAFEDMASGNDYLFDADGNLI